MSIAAAAGAVSKSVRDILASREEKRMQAALEARQAEQMAMQEEAQRASLQDRARGRQIEEAGIRLEGMAPNQTVEGADLSAITGTPYESRLEKHQTLPSRTIPAAGGAQMADAGGQAYSTLRPTAEQQDKLNLIANLRRIEEDPNTQPTLKRMVGLKRVGVNASAEDVETPQEKAARLAQEDKRKLTMTEGTEAIQHRNRLSEIAASGAQARETSAAKGTTKPSTGIERQSLAFYNRAKTAADTIEGEGMEDAIAKMGLAGQARLQVAPNILQSQLGQSYRQAQRAFTEARLRKESGAAINDAEYEKDAKTYFAQPGDSAETIQQKRAARGEVLDGLAFAAGPAYQEFYGESRVAHAKPSHAPSGGDDVQKWGRDAQGRPVRLK